MWSFEPLNTRKTLNLRGLGFGFFDHNRNEVEIANGKSLEFSQISAGVEELENHEINERYETWLRSFLTVNLRES